METRGILNHIVMLDAKLREAEIRNAGAIRHNLKLEEVADDLGLDKELDRIVDNTCTTQESSCLIQVHAEIAEVLKLLKVDHKAFISIFDADPKKQSDLRAALKCMPVASKYLSLVKDLATILDCLPAYIGYILQEHIDYQT